MSDDHEVMTSILDWFGQIEDWVPGAKSMVGELLIGQIPNADANNVYDLADQWGQLAEALNSAYEDVMQMANPIIESWSGDGAAQQFVSQWFAYLEGLRQTAESAAQMQQGVQAFGLEVELMKFMAALNLVMLAVSLFMLIAAAVPTGGGSLTAAPGLFAGTRIAIGQAAQKTIGKIAAIAMRVVMRSLTRLFGKVPVAAAARRAATAVTQRVVPRIITNRAVTAAGRAATRIGLQRAAKVAARPFVTAAARGVSKTVANRLAAQEMRRLAAQGVYGRLRNQATRQVQRQLAREIQRQLMRQWAGKQVARHAAQSTLRGIAEKKAAEVALGREFASYVGTRVAFGAGFMGGGNLLGQFGQIVSGNRTDGVDWGQVKTGAVQGAVFGAGMFGGPVGHMIGGAAAGGGLALGQEVYAYQTTGGEDRIDWSTVKHGARDGAMAGAIFGTQASLEHAHVPTAHVRMGDLRIGADVRVLPGEHGGFDIVATRANNREALLLTGDGYVAWQGKDGTVTVPDAISDRAVTTHVKDEVFSKLDVQPARGSTGPGGAGRIDTGGVRTETGGGAATRSGDGAGPPSRSGDGGGGPRQNASGGGPTTRTAEPVRSAEPPSPPAERVRVPGGDGPPPGDHARAGTPDVTGDRSAPVDRGGPPTPRDGAPPPADGGPPPTRTEVTTDRAPTDRVPGDHTPADHTPAGRAPADPAPTDRVPAADRAPADHAAGDRAVADRSSADPTPQNRASADHAPTQRPPTERAAIDRAPVDGAPADRTSQAVSRTGTDAAPAADRPLLGGDRVGPRDGGPPPGGDRFAPRDAGPPGGDRVTPRDGGPPGGDRVSPRDGGPPGGDRVAPREAGPLGGDRFAPRDGGPPGDRVAPRDGGPPSGERPQPRDGGLPTGDRAAPRDGSSGAGDRAPLRDGTPPAGDRPARDTGPGDRAASREGDPARIADPTTDRAQHDTGSRDVTPAGHERAGDPTTGGPPHDPPIPAERTADEVMRSAGAEVGDPATPESIRQGTVRMELHPDFPAVVRMLDSYGFRLVEDPTGPRVVVRHVYDAKGKVILREEREILYRDGMRFLDLEHEIDHVNQLKDRFNWELGTTAVRELAPDTLRKVNGPQRILSDRQDSVVEYHVRLQEAIRLIERGVDPTIIREHLQGVNERKELMDQRIRSGGPKLERWRDEHFGDIPALRTRLDELRAEFDSGEPRTGGPSHRTADGDGRPMAKESLPERTGEDLGGTGERHRDDGTSDRLREDPGDRDAGAVPLRSSHDGPPAGDRQGRDGGHADGRDAGPGVRGGGHEDPAAAPGAGQLAGGRDVRGVDPYRLVPVDGPVVERPVAAPQEVAAALNREVTALVEGRDGVPGDQPTRADWDARTQTLRIRYGDGLEVDVALQVNESVPPGRAIVVRPPLEAVDGVGWRQTEPAGVVLSSHLPGDPAARGPHVQESLREAWRTLHDEVAGQLGRPADGAPRLVDPVADGPTPPGRPPAPEALRALEDPVAPEPPVRDADAVTRHPAVPADPPAPTPLTPDTVRQALTGRGGPEQIGRWAGEHLADRTPDGRVRPRSPEEIAAVVDRFADQAVDLVGEVPDRAPGDRVGEAPDRAPGDRVGEVPDRAPGDRVGEAPDRGPGDRVHQASPIEGTDFVPDGRPESQPGLSAPDLHRAAGHALPHDFADGLVTGVTSDGHLVRVGLADGGERVFVARVGHDMPTLAETVVRAGTPDDPHVVTVNHRVAADQLPRVWVHEITETLALQHAAQSRPEPHGLVRRAMTALGRIFGLGGDAPRTDAPPRVDPHVAARLNERVHLQRLHDEAYGSPERQARLRREIDGVERDLAALGHRVDPPETYRQVRMPDWGVPDTSRLTGVLGRSDGPPSGMDGGHPGRPADAWHPAAPGTQTGHAPSGWHPAAPGAQAGHAPSGWHPADPAGVPDQTGPHHLDQPSADGYDSHLPRHTVTDPATSSNDHIWTDPAWQREGRPPSLDELIPSSDAEVDSWGGAVRQAFTERLTGARIDGGITLRMAFDGHDGVSVYRNVVDVRVELVHPEHGTVGSSVRSFRRDGQGDLIVEHSSLSIRADMQGTGLARRYNEFLEGWYRESGVSRIEIHASRTIGGYAWARMDYRWAPDTLHRVEPILDRLRAEVHDIDRHIGPDGRLRASDAELPALRDRYGAEHPDELVAEMRRQQAAAQDILLRSARHEFGTDGYPTPREISEAGEGANAGRDASWIGKRALLGADWRGVREISGDGPLHPRQPHPSADPVAHSPSPAGGRPGPDHSTPWHQRDGVGDPPVDGPARPADGSPAGDRAADAYDRARWDDQDLARLPVVRGEEAVRAVHEAVTGTRSGAEFTGDPRMRRYAQSLLPEPGVTKLALHGLESGEVVVGGRRMSAADFASGVAELHRSGRLDLGDGPIRLVSCHSGVAEHSPAAALARALGREVTGATDVVWTYRDGRELVAAPDPVAGHLPGPAADVPWRTFGADGRETTPTPAAAPDPATTGQPVPVGGGSRAGPVLHVGADGALHAEGDPLGSHRTPDGRLHLDGDRDGTWRDGAELTLHHELDPPRTYRTEPGFQLRSAETRQPVHDPLARDGLPLRHRAVVEPAEPYRPHQPPAELVRVAEQLADARRELDDFRQRTLRPLLRELGVSEADVSSPAGRRRVLAALRSGGDDARVQALSEAVDRYRELTGATRTAATELPRVAARHVLTDRFGIADTNLLAGHPHRRGAEFAHVGFDPVGHRLLLLETGPLAAPHALPDGTATERGTPAYVRDVLSTDRRLHDQLHRRPALLDELHRALARGDLEVEFHQLTADVTAADGLGVVTRRVDLTGLDLGDVADRLPPPSGAPDPVAARRLHESAQRIAAAFGDAPDAGRGIARLTALDDHTVEVRPGRGRPYRLDIEVVDARESPFAVTLGEDRVHRVEVSAAHLDGLDAGGVDRLLARAVGHTHGEVRASTGGWLGRFLGMHGGRPAAHDALVPDTVPGGRLRPSHTDLTRLSEFDALARLHDTATGGRRDALEAELGRFIERHGLREGQPGADARLELARRQLTGRSGDVLAELRPWWRDADPVLAGTRKVLADHGHGLARVSPVPGVHPDRFRVEPEGWTNGDRPSFTFQLRSGTVADGRVAEFTGGQQSRHFELVVDRASFPLADPALRADPAAAYRFRGELRDVLTAKIHEQSARPGELLAGPLNRMAVDAPTLTGAGATAALADGLGLPTPVKALTQAGFDVLTNHQVNRVVTVDKVERAHDRALAQLADGADIVGGRLQRQVDAGFERAADFAESVLGDRARVTRSVGPDGAGVPDGRPVPEATAAPLRDLVRVELREIARTLGDDPIAHVRRLRPLGDDTWRLVVRGPAHNPQVRVEVAHLADPARIEVRYVDGRATLRVPPELAHAEPAAVRSAVREALTSVAKRQVELHRDTPGLGAQAANGLRTDLPQTGLTAGIHELVGRHGDAALTSGGLARSAVQAVADRFTGHRAAERADEIKRYDAEQSSRMDGATRRGVGRQLTELSRTARDLADAALDRIDADGRPPGTRPTAAGGHDAAVTAVRDGFARVNAGHGDTFGVLRERRDADGRLTEVVYRSERPAQGPRVRITLRFDAVPDGPPLAPGPRRVGLGRFEFVVNTAAEPARVAETLSRVADNIMLDREQSLPWRRRLVEDLLPAAARAVGAAGAGLVGHSVAGGALAGVAAVGHPIGRWSARLHQLRLNDIAVNKALADAHRHDASPHDLRDHLADQRQPVEELERRVRQLEQRLAADPRTADEVAALRDRYGDLPTSDRELLPQVDERIAGAGALPRGARLARVEGAEHTWRVEFTGARGRPDSLSFEVRSGRPVDGTPLSAHRVNSDVSHVLRVDPGRRPDEIARAVHEWLADEVSRAGREPAGLPSTRVRLLRFTRESAGGFVSSAFGVALGDHRQLADTVTKQAVAVGNTVVGAGAKEAGNVPFDGNQAVAAQHRGELLKRYFGTASEEHLAVFRSEIDGLLERTWWAHDRLRHLEQMAGPLPDGERPEAFRHGPVGHTDAPARWGGAAPEQPVDPRDLDPTPRPGETPEQAADRADWARVELVHHQLGDEPPVFDLVQNDRTHAAHGAHTIERHGPAVPLARDPGQRTIEGRIYGDAPWPRPENYSYRWLSRSEMSSTINEYVAANWARIRDDLTFEGIHVGTATGRHAVGEGYFNSGMYGSGPRAAQYHVTSQAKILIRLVPGSSPHMAFVLTAYPTASGG